MERGRARKGGWHPGGGCADAQRHRVYGILPVHLRRQLQGDCGAEDGGAQWCVEDESQELMTHDVLRQVYRRLRMAFRLVRDFRLLRKHALRPSQKYGYETNTNIK